MNNLRVRIISPKQVIFDGEALSLTSSNSMGRFDILPRHANFITLIQNSPILIRKPDKTTQSFKFEVAIIYTSANQINIYTDIQPPQI